MPEYEIVITRTERVTKVFRVTADDIITAEKDAMNESYDTDFGRSHSAQHTIETVDLIEE